MAPDTNPTEPPRPAEADALALLGGRLESRVDEVVARVIAHLGTLDEPLPPTAEEDVARVVRISTAAVAQWMAGAPVAVAREVGWEAWAIFGRLTVERTIPLDRFMKSCLHWRDSPSR